MGCAKNLVDSEVMLGRLMEAGCEHTADPADAEIIIVNTCSFIKNAAEESIDTILGLADYRNRGKCQRLIVTGCLPERYGSDIATALPEVDFFLGTGAYHMIERAVKGESDNGIKYLLPDPDSSPKYEYNGPRVRSTPHIAYLKIAEGCSRHCTYCIIPKLRGKQRSRHIDEIIIEAEQMIRAGAKELVLVAQDTTAYGRDTRNGETFDSLLRAVSEIDDSIWIRFLYGHPESINNNVIKIVAEHENICSYFDIPVQHASDSMLKSMGRKHTRDDLLKLFDTIRDIDPEAALRTTVITGFPGETENDFKILLDFVKKVSFDHLGVFAYSDSEDLPSHALPGHVPEDVAGERLDRLMTNQANISLAKNKNRVGETVSVLVEKNIGKNNYTGRTSFQAPEVDGITFIQSSRIEQGSFANIRIIGASEYDLEGEAV